MSKTTWTRRTAHVAGAAVLLSTLVACGSSGSGESETAASETTASEEAPAETTESAAAEETDDGDATSSEEATETAAEMVAVPSDDPITQVPVPADFSVVAVSSGGIDPATLSLQADPAEAVDYYEAYFQGLGYATQRDVTWTVGENSGVVELVFAGPGVYGSVTDFMGSTEVWLRREPFVNGVHDGLAQ